MQSEIRPMPIASVLVPETAAAAVAATAKPARTREEALKYRTVSQKMTCDPAAASLLYGAKVVSKSSSDDASCIRRSTKMTLSPCAHHGFGHWHSDVGECRIPPG